MSKFKTLIDTIRNGSLDGVRFFLYNNHCSKAILEAAINEVNNLFIDLLCNSKSQENNHTIIRNYSDINNFLLDELINIAFCKIEDPFFSESLDQIEWDEALLDDLLLRVTRHEDIKKIYKIIDKKKTYTTNTMDCVFKLSSHINENNLKDHSNYEISNTNFIITIKKNGTNFYNKILPYCSQEGVELGILYSLNHRSDMMIYTMLKYLKSVTKIYQNLGFIFLHSTNEIWKIFITSADLHSTKKFYTSKTIEVWKKMLVQDSILYSKFEFMKNIVYAKNYIMKNEHQALSDHEYCGLKSMIKYDYYMDYDFIKNDSTHIKFYENMKHQCNFITHNSQIDNDVLHFGKLKNTNIETKENIKKKVIKKSNITENTTAEFNEYYWTIEELLKDPEFLEEMRQRAEEDMEKCKLDFEAGKFVEINVYNIEYNITREFEEVDTYQKTMEEYPLYLTS
ncbi:MAG: hypothetical protein ACI8ZF_000018 [Candidatus Midichloriaceae bacterium]|jgi:hypothetical protein